MPRREQFQGRPEPAGGQDWPERDYDYDETRSERDEFYPARRTGPEPAYGYSGRETEKYRYGYPEQSHPIERERRSRARDERPRYEDWLRSHQREPRRTEAERQLEGLQDDREVEARAQPRTVPQRTQASAPRSARVEPKSATRNRNRPKTKKGETKRRLEDNSEMSRT